MIVGAEGAGRRPFRGETHQDRMAAEQDLLLAGEMLRIRVDRHVVPKGRVGKRRGPRVDMVQQPLQQTDLLVPDHQALPCCSLSRSYVLSRPGAAQPMQVARYLPRKILAARAKRAGDRPARA